MKARQIAPGLSSKSLPWRRLWLQSHRQLPSPQVRHSTSRPSHIAASNLTTSSNGNGNGNGKGSRGWTKAATAGMIMGIAGFSAGAVFTRDSGSTRQPNHPTTTTNTPKRYASHTEMLHAASEIARLLGPDAITYDADVLEHHGRRDWSTSNSPGRAVAVVYPRSTADVSAIARVCHARRVPMVPFGAGSSVEGNFAQPWSGICIDFCFMDQVVAFHEEDMDVVVQAGVNWVDLNKKIAGSGLFFPMDPSPTATVGGMVATNCSGTNAFRYGTMKDWVLSLTVVLADGTVINTRRRPRKTSAGYNLTALFVGAEGTLGMVTEATLKLAPIPEATSVAVVPFTSIAAAAKAATALIRDGVPLAALELMDDVQMRILNAHGSEEVRKRKWAEQPTLFLKFAGDREGIASAVKRTESILKSSSVGGAAGDKPKMHAARSPEESASLWAARKECLFAMTALLPEGHALWSTDVAVPISRLAEMVDWAKRECSALGLFASVVGHVGDGNFHVAMMYDPQDPEQKSRVKRCVEDMMKKALEMEGTVSGEHAIGIGKKECLLEELGDDVVGVMRALKGVVDPRGVMNPGKVFD